MIRKVQGALGVSRLSLIGVLLLSWWAAAGAVVASDAGLRAGTGVRVFSLNGDDAPVWIDTGRRPIASVERRDGGPSGAPPARAAVVHIDIPARAGALRPSFGITDLCSEYDRVLRGRRTRGPPAG